MTSLQDIRTAIQSHIPEVLGHFAQIITEEEPWMLLPEARRTDCFGELILHLSEVALGNGSRTARVRQMLHAAARYGEERLAHGFPEALVFREHYLLRQALWSHIGEAYGACDPIAF